MKKLILFTLAAAVLLGQNAYSVTDACFFSVKNTSSKVITVTLQKLGGTEVLQIGPGDTICRDKSQKIEGMNEAGQWSLSSPIAFECNGTTCKSVKP